MTFCNGMAYSTHSYSLHRKLIAPHFTSIHYDEEGNEIIVKVSIMGNAR